MEMAARLCKSNWLPPSRISCNQFSHLLRKGSKSQCKVSKIPHDVIASQSITEETQMPGWFRKIQDRQRSVAKECERLEPDLGLWLLWLCCRWDRSFKNCVNDLSVKSKQKCGQKTLNSGSCRCADNSSSFPQAEICNKLLLSIPTGQGSPAR